MSLSPAHIRYSASARISTNPHTATNPRPAKAYHLKAHPNPTRPATRISRPRIVLPRHRRPQINPRSPHHQIPRPHPHQIPAHILPPKKPPKPLNRRVKLRNVRGHRASTSIPRTPRANELPHLLRPSTIRTSAKSISAPQLQVTHLLLHPTPNIEVPSSPFTPRGRRGNGNHKKR